MTQQGPEKHNQNSDEIAKRNKKHETELGNDMQIGNRDHQSQKKSGKQANKK